MVLRDMRVRVDIFCLQIVHVIHRSKDDTELRHLVSNFRQMAASMSMIIYGHGAVGAPKGIKSF